MTFVKRVSFPPIFILLFIHPLPNLLASALIFVFVLCFGYDCIKFANGCVLFTFELQVMKLG